MDEERAALPETGHPPDEAPTPCEIGFGQLLEKIGRHEDEIVPISSDAHGRFNCVGWPHAKDAESVVEQYRHANCYFSVNTVRQLLTGYGRGKAEDVARLTAVPVDLDFAEGKCGSADIALKIQEDLAAILGPPAAVTDSGHGLHPYWPVADGHINAEFTATQAKALLARVHALVIEVADHYGARVDNIFDLSRVMRIPNTLNTKPGQQPVHARCFDGGGSPLTVAQLTAILDEMGVAEAPSPREKSTSADCDGGADGYLTEGRPSPKVLSRLAQAMDHCHALSLRGKDGTRHGNVRDDVLALAGLGKRGEPGVSGAIKLLRAEFIEQVGPDRGYDVAAREFDSLLARERLEEKLIDENNVVDDPFDIDPIPLTHRVDLPPFPTDALPNDIAAMVRAVSEATQTDPAMAATSALSALSACTGGHAEIEIRSGWREPLCLYTATIAAPGERKSAVQMFMTRPVNDVERRLVADGAAERMAAEQRKQVATKAVEQQRNRAALAEGDEAQREAFDQVIGAAQIADGIEVPPIPRLLADDCTPEAAASLLAEQGGTLAIISAEGGIFDIIAGRYSSKAVPNMDLWLKAYSGDPLRVDRKGRPPEQIPRPALTLGLMIQPAVLGAVAANQQFRGRGFLARILFARPVSKVGHRTTPSTPVDPEVERTYGATVCDLVRSMRGWLGDPPVLTLTEDAQQEFHRIEAAVEPTLGEGGELASLADWGAKFVGAVARITGMLHLAEHGPDRGPRQPVSAQTVLAAGRIGQYYKANAINAFAEMGTDQGIADAVYLLERIQHLGQNVVSERDVHAASSRSRFPKKTDLKPVLSVLVDHGYLAPLSKAEPTGGRPASPRYRVHPSVTQDTEATEGRNT
jgi:replicative DNA helicase